MKPTILARNHDMSHAAVDEDIGREPLVSSRQASKCQFTNVPEMQRSIKIVDGSMSWLDSASDVLLDQNTDFLVISAIGTQGAGKSTLLSLLAGNKCDDPYRTFIFRPQSYDCREQSWHQTEGIDVYVTHERILFLDCQPILSQSVLAQLCSREKKDLLSEFQYTENAAEINGLTLVSFLMAVSHIILVVFDGFADSNLLRLISTAEMLQPSSSGGVTEEQHDYHPHIVFLQTKAAEHEFTTNSYLTVQRLLAASFGECDLRCKGSLNMRGCEDLLPDFASVIPAELNYNYFILPRIPSSPQFATSGSVGYVNGCPHFKELFEALVRRLFSSTRYQLTASPNMTEKHWFQYANKMWSVVKKSPLLTEYIRIQP